MSILGALQSGISGLSAQSSAMGAISDNIVNMNTIGYKDSNVKFSTLVTKQASSSLYSPGGVQSASRQSISSQGLLSSVSSSTALGISGQGYFVVNANAQGTSNWAYTRAGDFDIDTTGHLVNSGGYYIQAWSLLPWDGTKSVSTVDINGITYMKAFRDEAGNVQYINDNIIDPNNLKSVNLKNIGGTATATTQINYGANLPSSDIIGSSHSVSALIYDSLGNASNMSLTYTKDTANSWEMNTSVPSGAASVSLYTPDNKVYASKGQMEFTQIPATGSTIKITTNGVTKTFEFTTSEAAAGNIKVDISGVTIVSEVLQRFNDALQNNMVDAGRFTISDNAIVINQSLSGSALEIDCSGTLACTQSAAGLDPATGLTSGKFTVYSVDDTLKNCGWINFNDDVTVDQLHNKTVTIDGKVFEFTKDGAVSAVDNIAVNLAGLPAGMSVGRYAATCLQDAIAGTSIAEPQRFVASGSTLQIVPTTSAADIVIDASGLAAVSTGSVRKAGAAGFDNITAGEVTIASTFVADGVQENGSKISGIRFAADGTPQTINVESMAIEWANGSANMTGAMEESPKITLNMGQENTNSGLTHLSGNFNTSYITQDGAKFGSYSSVSIDADGVVTAIFDNGETLPIAIIPLAMFTNPNSMEALNGNVWQETTASGQPLLVHAKTGGSGEIVSSALESSTVDLATELSDMIVTQRAYSASGKIITTADEMLEELTRLI